MILLWQVVLCMQISSVMNNRLMLKGFRDNTEQKTIFSVSILIGFMFCIFAPLEVYMAGKDGFFFSGIDVLPFSVLLFIVVTTVLTILATVIVHINDRIGRYVVTISFGLAVAFYLQGNYDTTDYGVWDGTSIDWNVFLYSKYLWWIVFVLCILLSLLAVKRIEKDKLSKIMTVSSFCLILVQAVTLMTLLISHNGLKKEPEYVAIEDGEGEFSAGENLIVLILDSYDSMMLTEILGDDEAGYYKGILSDFVFYQDTAGVYSFTNLAVPHIVTGKKYYNDMTYGEYLSNAYHDSELLNYLTDNDWNIGLYTDSAFPKDGIIAGNVQNCKRIDRTVTSHRRLMEYMYRLIGFRYLPQPLKKYCVYDGDIESQIGSNAQGYTLFGSMNKTFKRVYGEAKISGQDKVFKLIHIFGAHPPYYANADESETEIEASELDVCKDNLELVDGFLDKLREIGAYDNSTIIICADHGVMQLRQSPLFLIKARNESHDLIVSDIFFSYDSLQELLIIVADGGDEEDIKDYMVERSSKVREYLKYSHDTLSYDSYCADIEEYRISGPAYIEDNIVSTGKVYIKP